MNEDAQLIWEAYISPEPQEGAKSVNSEQLNKGIKVEMEHTNDRKIAEKIARDHLAEDPKYYDKLLKAGL